MTAAAYQEFVDAGSEWEDYLTTIADVEGRAPRTTILLAIDDHRVIGSATLELTDRVEPEDDPPLREGEAHIRMVGVAPDVRRSGVARALMHECIERARAAGKTFATLHTTHRMEAAQQMYEALGFRRGKDRTFPSGFVLLSYRLDL